MNSKLVPVVTSTALANNESVNTSNTPFKITGKEGSTKYVDAS